MASTQFNQAILNEWEANVSGVYAYGSNNSTDLDLFINLKYLPLKSERGIILQTLREATRREINEVFDGFGHKAPDLDISFVVIEDGVVVWSENGNVEETNNCIMATYQSQVFNEAYKSKGMSNPITHKLKQSVALKAIKTLRATITFLSRTKYRDTVKSLLRDGTFEERYDFIDKLMADGGFSDIEEFNKKQSKVEIYKDLAFYYAQLYALMNGKEIFTKSEVCLLYPELYPYILRNPDASGRGLESFIYEVLDELIHTIIFKPYGDAIRFDTENSYYSNKNEIKFEDGEF